MEYVDYNLNEEFVISSEDILSNYKKEYGCGDNKFRLRDGKANLLNEKELNYIYDIFHEDRVKFKEICLSTQKLTDDNFKFNVSIHQLFKKLKSEEVDMQYYNSVICIEVIHKQASLDYFMIKSNNDWISHINKIKKHPSTFIDAISEYNNKNLPLIFAKQAAPVFAHEVFGHMFEIDNFYNYHYDKYLSIVESLNLEMIDNPLIENSNGYYKFDDASIPAKKKVIFHDGKFTGSLIGGVYGKKIVDSALRRETYSNKLLPRMSNFSVRSYNTANFPFEYVEIVKFKKCYINHKKGEIVFHIDTAFYVLDNEYISRIKPFQLILTLEEIFRKIEPCDTIDYDSRPLQCQKQNQIVNCDSSSTNWIYRI